MREAVYHRIFQAIRGKGQVVSLASVEERTDPEGIRYVRSALSAGSNTYYLDWYEEAGNWRIRSGDVDIKAEGLDGKGAELTPEALSENEIREFPSGWQFGTGARIAWQYNSVFADVGYHIGSGRIGSIGTSLLVESVMVRDENNNISTEAAMISAGIVTRLGFGIGRSGISVFPYLELGGSLGMIISGEHAGTAGPTIPVGFGLAVTVLPNLSIGASADLQFTETMWESVYPEPGIHIKLYATLSQL